MNPRTCNITVTISNDAAAVSFYVLRPVPPAALGQSAAAFRLVNLSKRPAPVYVVRLAVDGQASCDCPAHNRAGRCKHADALLAAGLLPSQLVALLQSRTQLLDAAEAESQRLAEAAMMERTVHQHDAEAAADRIAELEGELAAVSERAVRLQQEVAVYHARKPQTRRPPAKKEAA